MKTMYRTTEEIQKELTQYHADKLAVGRTAMANDRTLLAFVRTALALLGGGVGLVAYLEHPVILAVGWLSIAASLVLFAWGFRRFAHIRRMIIDLSQQNE